MEHKSVILIRRDLGAGSGDGGSHASGLGHRGFGVVGSIIFRAVGGRWAGSRRGKRRSKERSERWRGWERCWGSVVEGGAKALAIRKDDLDRWRDGL